MKQMARKKKTRGESEKFLTRAMVRQIRRSLAYFARGGKGKSFEEVFGEPL